MRKTFLAPSLVACLFLLGTAQVLAHGWVPPSPPPAPGTAAAKATGINANSSGTTAGPAGAQTAAFTGPQGATTQKGDTGSGPDGVAGSGGSDGPTAQPGTTPSSPEPKIGPARAPKLPGLRGTTPGRGASQGRRGPGRRGRTQAFPWLSRMKVEWQSAFLPVTGNQGYDGTVTSIGAALTKSPQDGGWVRETLPSAVLVYDPSDKNAIRAIDALDGNLRFVSASQLFNCFRIDSRSFSKKNNGVALHVFDAKGTLVKKITGTRSLKGAFRALRTTFDATAPVNHLDKRLPSIQRTLNALAKSEHELEQLHGSVVDPATGKVRKSILKAIRSLTKERTVLKRTLKGLKAAD